jgi:hypothetical protein
MSQIKYNYYTNIVIQKTKRLSRKQNIGSLHNPQKYATRATQAYNSSSKNSTPYSSSEQQVLSSRRNSKDEYTCGWYLASVENSDMQDIITKVKL